MNIKLLITILIQPALEVALASAECKPKHTLTVGPCLLGQSYGQNGIGTLQGNKEYVSC